MNDVIKDKLIKTASKSPCRFKVSAVAFSKKGNILGWSYCNHGIESNGGSIHAERYLMSKYGRAIHTILITRINKSGKILPIEPCNVCQKVADKMGITIKTVEE
mgnify:CR=1 FL=1